MDGVIDYCECLSQFPMRSSRRNDIRPGLCINGYRKQTVIASRVVDDYIEVLGVLNGGQDYSAVLDDIRPVGG